MVFINLLGLAAIVFIVWWFWLYQPKTAISDKNIDSDNR